MRRRWPGPGGGDAAPAAEPELVRRAAGGDRLAFERLYEAYVDRVHRYVIARVRDEATARDLVQDVFLSAMGGLHGLRQDERFAHWLFRLAHNRVANHWRDTARRPELVMLPGLGGAGDGPADSPPRELALLSGDDPRTLAEQGLAGAVVRAHALPLDPGRFVLVTTATDGSYFLSLEPGDYKVAAGLSGFRERWYRDADAADGALAVTVVAGLEGSGIDIALTQALAPTPE